MRASLQTGNLLTGKLYISFDYYEKVEPYVAQKFEDYTVLPTIPTGLGRLEKQVSDLLEKFNALPLDSLVANADTTLQTLDVTLEKILDEDATRDMPGEINRTLAELRQAISGVSPDSAVGQSLSSSILELNQAMRNLEELTRTLSAKPNSLIFSTDLPADPIPEARPQ